MNARVNIISPSSRPFAAAALAVSLLVMLIISGSSSTSVSAFSARAGPMSVHHRAATLNHYFETTMTTTTTTTTAALPHHHFDNSVTFPAKISSVARRKSTTCLRMNFSPPDNKDIGGLNEGKYLLLFVLSACIWIFSIPPEFRRARFCTDEDVRLYPEKHCTTFDAWRTGISEYYANGGGVQFDFSIEGK